MFWSWKYLFIDGAFVPSCLDLVAAFQRLPRFLDVVEEEPQLAGDEVRVVGVARPGADVDDIEGLIDEVADGDELVQDQRGCGRCGGEV